jgi:hypothetical protein
MNTITATTEAPIHHNAKALLHFYYNDYLERPSYEFNQLRIAKKNTESKTQENIVAKEKVLMLYPNPAKDEVNMQFDNIADINNLSITITDVLGKIVLQQVILLNNNKFVFTTDKLPNGIYTCKIMNGDRKLEIKKLVVVK